MSPEPMFVNEETGGFFFAKNYHTFQNALLVAEGGCKIVNESSPEACELYATIVPKGFSAAFSDENGISQEAERFFKGEFSRKQKPGRFGAFAISATTAVGESWDQPSEERAKSVAMEICKTRVAKTVASFGEIGRKAFVNAGLAKCRIVAVVTG